ncbi:MAG TPA: ParB/RepB/Spo0J family partition protein [Pyrinomonadaceae bacterium]|nr:ParB/RepB/Spo0J family partition protein [Pyrinomonadaceae bacterium]
MPKSGLPLGVKMRHDSHYVDQIASHSRSVGRTIPISSIFPNPEQPRTEFGDLSELTASIREKGVLEPLLVKPKPEGRFMIIAGERRWRASQAAGLTEVPCIELDIDDNAVAEIALIENLQRKDLTVWEEADGLAALVAKFGYTHDQIALKISKSRSTVTEFLTIAGLPAAIREKCRNAKINSKGTLLDVARQFDEAAMFEYLDQLETGKTIRRPNGDAGRKKADVGEPKLKDATLSKERSFVYRSPGNEFTLELRFADTGYERADILKAIKQAFEDIKSKPVEGA